MTTPQTIVVTGGAGFIGSHLCEVLAKAGHKVISLDNYFTGSRDSHVEGVEYREGHTKDIAKHIPETPDIIYHLGEYSRVEISFTEPALVWDFNIRGTFGVLEFWRKKKCKLVYAGSSTKFGDGGMGRDQSPYAWSKASNTELVKNYGSWYGLPYAIAYFYNVYGPRERAGKYGTLIEMFIQKVLGGEKLSVVSPGTQKRNFTHVHDIVAGLILIGEQGKGDDYGIGRDRSYSILEVARLFGKDIEMLPPRAGNRMDSTIDTSKVRTLGWKCKHDLEEYIQKSLVQSN
ncbi:MAG: NAD-dependent epimerase/dehydratase family protein [Candidatus Adlerbacteria bacterium]|nr:NAD-dependent epimerase/dehydratase family protein [Candidatus Adlerbacteria bacterium]